MPRFADGFCAIDFEGASLAGLLNEAGGHRIQRIPPTERSGRVHTSTVTVAVVEAGSTSPFVLLSSDLKIEWFSGTGKGGQYRNKHQNSCRLTHVPTGTMRVGASARDRESNLAAAKAALLEALSSSAVEKEANASNSIRRGQIGSGMRGDKRRTYRFRDNKVVDHVSGKQASCEQAMRGMLDQFWS